MSDVFPKQPPREHRHRVRKESLCLYRLQPSLTQLEIPRSKAGLERSRETQGDSALATALGELGLVLQV